jgi:hypothetical protein
VNLIDITVLEELNWDKHIPVSPQATLLGYHLEMPLTKVTLTFQLVRTLLLTTESQVTFSITPRNSISNPISS